MHSLLVAFGTDDYRINLKSSPKKIKPQTSAFIMKELGMRQKYPTAIPSGLPSEPAHHIFSVSTCRLEFDLLLLMGFFFPWDLSTTSCHGNMT